jgi:hypothetical protein
MLTGSGEQADLSGGVTIQRVSRVKLGQREIH